MILIKTEYGQLGQLETSLTSMAVKHKNGSKHEESVKFSGGVLWNENIVDLPREYR